MFGLIEEKLRDPIFVKSR